MYACTIDFQMLYQINMLLKEKGYNVTIHTIGGCSCNGIELKNLNDSNRELIKEIINDYLKNKYMYIKDDPTNKNYFTVSSTFDK